MGRLGILVIAAALLVSACTPERANVRPVFVRANLTPDGFSEDYETCESDAAKQTKLVEDRGHMTNAGFPLVWDWQKAAVHNYHLQIMFQECMFRRGYTLIGVPEGVGTDPRTEDDKFDKRQGALDLIESGEADELIAWEIADSVGSRERLEGYLKTYPDGHFAEKARERLAEKDKAKPSKPE